MNAVIWDNGYDGWLCLNCGHFWAFKMEALACCKNSSESEEVAMTIKEARKQVSEAGFTVQREGEDLLLWGYSPQGAPSSRLFFRLKNTSGLREIAECAQRARAGVTGYKSPYQTQLAISNIWHREY